MANPPLVVPGVVRFTVLGTIAQRRWANVFDVDFGASAPVGGGVMKGLAEKLMDTYAVSIATDCVAQWTIDACRWIDLNSALGETGYTNDTVAHTFPFAGQQATDPLPASVAVMLRKSTQGTRNHRNGRAYMCGIPEAATSGNKLTTTGLNDWGVNAQNLVTTLTGSTSGIGHIFCVAGRDKNMAVHKAVVSSMNPDSILATQRRRLRA